MVAKGGCSSPHRGTVLIIRCRCYRHVFGFLGTAFARVMRLKEEEEVVEDNIESCMLSQTFPLLVLCCFVEETTDTIRT